MATAYAQLKREHVDVIQRKVLSEENYTGHQMIKRGEPKNKFRVTNPKDSYLMDDENATHYFERLNSIHLSEGFEDAAKGLCPALVAESLVRDAELLLIEEAEKHFPELTNHILLCAGLDKRKKYIDILIGMVVSVPDYENPLEATK